MSVVVPKVPDPRLPEPECRSSNLATFTGRWGLSERGRSHAGRRGRQRTTRGLAVRGLLAPLR
jgi:hypothetical protein